MARIAKRAIAVVEVIAPNDTALAFARQLLPWKEPGRDKTRIFTEADLTGMVMQVSIEARCLHFDQYIDVNAWLEHSDLSLPIRDEICRFVENQTNDVKKAQHIHWRGNSLFMLRRTALIIGILDKG
jgi:hypothetical protein